MNDEFKIRFIENLDKQLKRILNEDVKAFEFFSIDDIKESFGLNVENEVIIEKLVSNRKPFSSLGICNHDDDFLCEHRKKYILNSIIKIVSDILEKGDNNENIQS